MSKVRNKDSGIEIAFRKALWQAGFRYRKNVSSRFGKPDIVLPKYRTVIFVDSCFWHGCKKHGSMPQTRKAFWKTKITQNITRDKIVNRWYKKQGWIILRFWEHDIHKNTSQKVLKTVAVLTRYKS